MDVKSYIKAARLRTLPLSISGVILGSYLGNAFVNSILENGARSSIFESLIFLFGNLKNIGFKVLYK
jgi:1,4-dihydroxy-2-naphthoate octaprenyltransferase